MKTKFKKSLLVSLLVALIGALICLTFVHFTQNNAAYADEAQETAAVQVDVSVQADDKEDKTPDFGWAIIVAAVVDVALVVWLVVQLARRDKKKKNDEKLNSLIGLPLLAAGLAATSQYIIIGILGCVAVALLAGNIVMLVQSKKAKKEQTGQQPEAAAEEQLAEAQPVEEVVEEQSAEEAVEEVAEEQPAEETVEEAAEEQLAEEAVEEVAEEQPAEETVEEVAEEQVIQSQLVEQAADEDEGEDAPESEEDEEEETEVLRGVDESTGLAIVVRYKKSFLAKLIQSNDEIKGYYSTLKNALLSYNKVKSRVSWNYDSINFGREKLAKFVMRGKTLCLYFNLNPDNYTETNIKVERSQSKKFEDVPCLYRIKNPRRAKYAVDLIADLAVKFNLEKGEEQNVDYYMPYEATEPLVERELIKELVSKENYEEFMRRRSLRVIDKNRRQFVSAAEVNSIIEDEVAMTLVETEEVPAEAAAAKKRYRKKSIVNIDSLSKHFKAGETVNIQTLKEREIVAKDVDYIKVLARGTLDKALKVEAQDYSVEAIKMILLTGGHVKKVV